MKRLIIITGLMMIGSLKIGGVYVTAGCGDTWQTDRADTASEPRPAYTQTLPISITKYWRIFWTDGYERRNAEVTETGEDHGNYFSTTHCHPRFFPPRWETNTAGTGDWVQTKWEMRYLPDTSDDCNLVAERKPITDITAQQVAILRGNVCQVVMAAAVLILKTDQTIIVLMLLIRVVL